MDAASSLATDHAATTRPPNFKDALGRCVLIVTPGGLRDSAGIGRLITSITRQWQKNGGPVHRIVDSYGPGRLGPMPFYLMGAVLQIVGHKLRRSAALVHVHMATRGSVARKTIIVRVAKGLRLPVVLHLHGDQFDSAYRRLPAVLRRFICSTMRRADVLVVLGERWRDTVASELGIDAERVRVLYNAVSGPPALPHRESPPCRILFLGRLSSAKGVPELIDALSHQKLAPLEWHARLAGFGDVDALRQRVSSAGLAHRIAIHGWTPEPQVRAWLAESDIFVLPSHDEGMSVAVLEAMAFGLAVITTPVGANTEAVIDGVSGILVPVGSHADLVEALYTVITDGALRRRLQLGARRRFEENFDIAIHSRQLQELYGELMRVHSNT